MQNRNKCSPRHDTSPVLDLEWDVFRSIVETIGVHPAETGGALGGQYDGTITHYHFDETSRHSSVTYSPDHELLNTLFREEWNPAGVRLRGFIHSHPACNHTPSRGDEIYAERILACIPDLESLWVPIANSAGDIGEFRLTPWLACRDEDGARVVRGRVRVSGIAAGSMPATLGDVRLSGLRAGVDLHEIVLPAVRARRLRSSVRHTQPRPAGRADATFDRVRQAYDLELMRSSRIIAVGAGGAASWLEELARAGLGQFVLIDGDRVSESNLATQQVYRRDIGRPKVDCIAERILDINPDASIVAIDEYLDACVDEPVALSDEDLEKLAFGEIEERKPGRTVIAGLTDAFFPQARVNRIALKLGIPSLCAQVYLEGRGAEVSFTYPGVTPACHRCMLRSRYRYFLDEGGTHTVTSHGTAIFSTTRLNAVKGMMMLALLHHGTTHPRWGKMLSRIGKRSLLQIRMDPDLAETLGLQVFDRIFANADGERVFWDETAWLPQDQDSPETGYPSCPDCGGTGDLRNVIGTIADTRLTRRVLSDGGIPGETR